MKLLLDTHAFLWWVAGDDRLSQRARRAITDGRNEVLFSVVSAWEIVVKVGIGRLELAAEPGRFILDQVQENAFSPLPLQLSHALQIATLPSVHRDPFDRLLVAQAIVEGASIISGDRVIHRYPVTVRW